MQAYTARSMPRARSYPQSVGFAMVILIAQGLIARVAFSQSSDAEWGEKCTPYASVPMPAEAEHVSTPKESPACASYKSYRGIGRPVNYSEARDCAWQERAAQKAGLSQNGKEPTAWVVGGSLILADIYYNGAGVKKNVPLAMRFACEFEESTANLAMEDLAKSGDAAAHKPLEFCHYAATTFTENFCTNYESEIDDGRRRRFYNSLKKSMTREQVQAFDALLAAENRYIDEHSLEVYQGGTIRNIRTNASQEILDDLFHNEIVHFERKHWPVLSAKQIAGADALLDSEYAKAVQRVKEQPKDDSDDGLITVDDLAKAEGAWKEYREAWTMFARARYPSEAEAIVAEVTLRRYQLIKKTPFY